MIMIDRLRHRRRINRQNRALDHAWKAAPTPAMREELAVFAQRRIF
jgi:hypothetical protein